MKQKLIAIAALLALPAISVMLIGEGPYFGCQAPVSDEATVTLSGRLLLTDGTPASGIAVKLHKTDLDVLDVDWLVGTIVNTQAKAFKETTTDSNGEFYFEFGGAEANAKNNNWAAYFVAWAAIGDGTDKPMAIATDSFQFSNNNLDVDLGEIAFWDMGDVPVTVSANEVTFDWPESERAPEQGKYVLYVDGTAWTEEVEGTTFSLPLTALEPCEGPVSDDAEECVTKTEHKVHLVSLTDGMRYRTAWHSFSVANPRGVGVWYRDPDDNTSGRTCSDKNLFDLVDGKFSGESAVQVMGGGVDAEDFRCLVLNLRGEVTLDELFIHNATVFDHKNAVIELLTASAEEPAEGDWEVLSTWEGGENRFWNLNLQIPGEQRAARWLKIQFTDEKGTPTFARIGEISIYGETN